MKKVRYKQGKQGLCGSDITLADGRITWVVGRTSCTHMKWTLEALATVNLCQWWRGHTGDVVESSALCNSATPRVDVRNSAHEALVYSCTAQRERLINGNVRQYAMHTVIYRENTGQNFRTFTGQIIHNR